MAKKKKPGDEEEHRASGDQISIRCHPPAGNLAANDGEGYLKKNEDGVLSRRREEAKTAGFLFFFFRQGYL